MSGLEHEMTGVYSKRSLKQEQESMSFSCFQSTNYGTACPCTHTHIYGFITKLCRQQSEVIQNHENEHVHSIGQGETRHRKYKRFKFGGGQAYDRSSD
jgi:hypothetical protein